MSKMPRIEPWDGTDEGWERCQQQAAVFRAYKSQKQFGRTRAFLRKFFLRLANLFKRRYDRRIHPPVDTLVDD